MTKRMATVLMTKKVFYKLAVTMTLKKIIVMKMTLKMTS